VANKAKNARIQKQQELFDGFFFFSPSFNIIITLEKCRREESDLKDRIREDERVMIMTRDKSFSEFDLFVCFKVLFVFRLESKFTALFKVENRIFAEEKLKILKKH
jgi:hypothetical protein